MTASAVRASRAEPLADILPISDPAGMQIGRALFLVIVLLAAVAGGLVALITQPIAGRVSLIVPEPLAVTIDQLRSRPKEFAGKLVKIAGQLDECYGWECSLCPESMTTKRSDAKGCLPLSFRPLIPETGFGSSEQESVFRFTNVVLTAKFDPSCWQSPCFDRQTVLEGAQVTEVGKRRSSRDGLWLGRHTGLAELTGPFVAKVTEAAYAAGYPEGPPIKVFKALGDPGKLVVCWTSLASASGSWPDSLEGSYAPGKSDFYRCNTVRNRQGVFVLQTDN